MQNPIWVVNACSKTAFKDLQYKLYNTDGYTVRSHSLHCWLHMQLCNAKGAKANVQMSWMLDDYHGNRL